MPDINHIVEQLKKLPIVSPKYCDNCGTQHSVEDTRFMGQQDANFVFQVACRNCNLSYLLRVSSSSNGMAAQRLDLPNMDLNPDELRKFAGKPKVDKEEALQVYTDMKSVKTLDDFLKLFGN